MIFMILERFIYKYVNYIYMVEDNSKYRNSLAGKKTVKKCSISILKNDLQYLAEIRVGQSEFLRQAVSAHKSGKFEIKPKEI